MPDTGRLLQQAREGDRDAQDALFARHRRRLVAFVRARSPAELVRSLSPEDIVQETHLEAVRKLDTFEDRGPASFYCWLVAIARFKLAEAVRARQALKRSRETALPEDAPSTDTSPSGGAEKAERAARLRDALADLPGDQGEALRLRYLEGLSVAETAGRLGKSEGAVKMLVSRGLAILAEGLGPSPPS